MAMVSIQTIIESQAIILAKQPYPTMMTDLTGTTHNQGNPWPLYLIFGMVALVLISGYLLRPKTEEGKLAWVEFLGTTNKGVLLNPPVEIMDNQIVGPDGRNGLSTGDNTWKLLVLVADRCEQPCVARLTELQAMRIRLNRDADRLAIGLLWANQTVPPGEVAEFRGMNTARFANADLLLQLKQTNMPSLATGPVVLLMNPINIVMMAYGTEHTGVEMLEDLKHLLDLAG